MTDGDGGPLGVVIAGANVLERRLLAATIESIVVERPEPTKDEPQHMPLDKAYDNPTGEGAATAAGYTPHIRRIGEEKKGCDRSQGHKPRDGWSSGRSHGCRSAAGSWCGTTRRTSTTSP